VQQSQLALWAHLEDGSEATVRPAELRCPIKVAGFVAEQTCVGILSIRRSREAVQQSQFALRAQLEDGSEAAVRATVLGRSVKIAGRTPQQNGAWIFTVGRAREAVKYGLLAARVQLKHGSETAHSTAV
jgi:hypothetical protein